jgi:hypothetical protein
MSKPYENLSKLTSGVFFCGPEKLLRVDLEEIDEKSADVAIGNGPAFGVQQNTAQVLSDFFGDLAKQLKP